MCYVYILISTNYSKTYTGFTAYDPVKRLSEHNKGCNHYTSKFKPWQIIYQEQFNNQKEAKAREKYLKSHAGRKFVKKIINNIPK